RQQTRVDRRARRHCRARDLLARVHVSAAARAADAELSANAPWACDRRSNDRWALQAVLRRRGQPRTRRNSGMGVVTDLRMNERAWTMADRAVERAVEMRLGVHTLAGGARVIDAGIDAVG